MCEGTMVRRRKGLGREISHWTSLIAMRRTWRLVPRHGIDMGRILLPFLVVLSSCLRDWRSLGKVRENEEEEAEEEDEEEEEEKQQVRV